MESAWAVGIKSYDSAEVIPIDRTSGISVRIKK